MNAWAFYVYEIFADGQCLYIGKGSGSRLSSQKRRFQSEGRELARFKYEDDAYEYEKLLIANRQPWYNRHPGGCGGRVIKRKQAKLKIPAWMRKEQAQFDRDIAEIGTRKYAALMLLKKGEAALLKHGLTVSNIDNLRQALHGTRYQNGW